MIQTSFTNIFWDFDGVIIDSNNIRTNGFRKVLSNYPIEQVEKLVEYHTINGGLSRYHKFAYFFEVIREERVSNDKIIELANNFKEIMLADISNPNLLISDTYQFLKQNQSKGASQYLVSASDQSELKIICSKLDLDSFFLETLGSPELKKNNVQNIITKYKLDITSACLIGDSINDLHVAKEKNITFIGYNNKNLMTLSDYYVNHFSQFEF